ncbi:MAG: hypothetical protein ACP5OO_07590 [Chloroflexia bacterium]
MHFLALAGYFLLTLLFTWPLPLHLTEALPGEGGDSWQYLWNFWWFDQALFHGQALYFTRAQYYPQGTSLLFHTLSPLNSLLGLPARALGGYLLAYNFIVLLAGTLSGYGTFLLAREVLRAGETGSGDPPSDLAAFLAGAVFALCPYRSVHLLGHLSLVSTETLPFFALFAFRALKRPGWRPALGIALAFLAAALIDWYYPLDMLLLAGTFLLWAAGETLLRRRTGTGLLRSAATLAAGLLLAGLLLAPLLVPMLREAGRATYLEEPLEFSASYGADLAAFFIPSPLHPLWGDLFRPWSEPFAEGNTAEGIVYLGFGPLLLAAIGLWKQGKEGKIWAATAGLFALLALGPYLKVLNRPTGVPLPYLWLYPLPILRFTRVPSRYVILTQLALAVLTALGARTLLRNNRAWPFSFLLALLVLEYLPIPYPLTPARVPTFYRQLAQTPGEEAVLEMPLQKPESPWYYTRWMLYQTVHGRPSFRGYISRGDPLFPFAGAPLFRQLAQSAPADDILYDDWRALAGSVLHHYRVGYIVLEKARLQEEGRLGPARALVEEALGGRIPDWEDEDLLVYRVPGGGEALPFFRLGRGWHEVEERPWGPFRWMERDRAELFVIRPQPGPATIEFQVVSFLRPRRLEVVWNGEPVASCTVGTALQRCRLSVDLPAGETRLELQAEGYDIPREAGVGDDPRPISIGFSAIRFRP